MFNFLERLSLEAHHFSSFDLRFPIILLRPSLHFMLRKSCLCGYYDIIYYLCFMLAFEPSNDKERAPGLFV
jgi:hypothetical protein